MARTVLTPHYSPTPPNQVCSHHSSTPRQHSLFLKASISLSSKLLLARIRVSTALKCNTKISQHQIPSIGLEQLRAKTSITKLWIRETPSSNKSQWPTSITSVSLSRRPTPPQLEILMKWVAIHLDWWTLVLVAHTPRQSSSSSLEITKTEILRAN